MAVALRLFDPQLHHTKQGCQAENLKKFRLAISLIPPTLPKYFHC